MPGSISAPSLQSDRLHRIYGHSFQHTLRYLENTTGSLLKGSWDIDFATSMIVFGGSVGPSIAEAIARREQQIATYRQDLGQAAKRNVQFVDAKNFIFVTNRFLELAKSEIAIGTLSDPDTPKNWLLWCENKGYKTDHFNPSAMAKLMGDIAKLYEQDVQNATPPLADWTRSLAVHYRWNEAHHQRISDLLLQSPPIEPAMVEEADIDGTSTPVESLGERRRRLLTELGNIAAVAESEGVSRTAVRKSINRLSRPKPEQGPPSGTRSGIKGIFK